MIGWIILGVVIWIFLGFVTQVLDRVECRLGGSEMYIPKSIAYGMPFIALPIIINDLLGKVSVRKREKRFSLIDRVADPLVRRLGGDQ